MTDIPENIEIPAGAQYYAPAETAFDEGFYKKIEEAWYFSRGGLNGWSQIIGEDVPINYRTLIPIKEQTKHEYHDHGIWMPVKINYESDCFTILEYLTGDDAGMETCITQDEANSNLRTKKEGEVYRSLLRAFPEEFSNVPIKEIKPIVSKLVKLIKEYPNEE